jgi:multiple antibiotic resistance protein
VTWESISSVLQEFFLSFVPVFVAMDGIGTLPIFLSLTHSFTANEKRKVIRDSVLTAFFAGIAFVLLGKGILSFLGVTVADFKIAGGVLLFILALNDLLQPVPKKRRMPHLTMGVVPIGIPLIVGPAVFTTLLILIDTRGPIFTMASFLLNVCIVWGLFRASDWLYKRLGGGGAAALSKVSSLFLAAIGVMMLRIGLQEIFHF